MNEIELGFNFFKLGHDMTVMRSRCSYVMTSVLSRSGLNQVELFKQPHLLLLQLNNSIFKLPGGRLRRGESGKLLHFNIYIYIYNRSLNLIEWIFLGLQGNVLRVRWDKKIELNFADIDGLRRKLSNKLSASRDGNETEWEVNVRYWFEFYLIIGIMLNLVFNLYIFCQFDPYFPN